MRIKLVKPVMMKGAQGVQFQAGSVAEVNPDIGREWVEKGYAVYAVIAKGQIENTVEVETAMVRPPENAMLKLKKKEKGR